MFENCASNDFPSFGDHIRNLSTPFPNFSAIVFCKWLSFVYCELVDSMSRLPPICLFDHFLDFFLFCLVTNGKESFRSFSSLVVPPYQPLTNTEQLYWCVYLMPHYNNGVRQSLFFYLCKHWITFHSRQECFRQFNLDQAFSFYGFFFFRFLLRFEIVYT